MKEYLLEKYYNKDNYIEALDDIVKRKEDFNENLLIEFFKLLDSTGGGSYINNIIEDYFEYLGTISVILIIYEKFNKDIENENHRRIINGLEISVNTLISLLESNPSSIKFIIQVLLIKEYSFTTEFLRASFTSLSSLSQIAIKGLSNIIKEISVDHFSEFTNYEFLLSSESPNLRISFIEILEKLLIKFKEESKLGDIAKITDIICLRLSDTNYMVRSKALVTLSTLFRSVSILKEKRNEVIESICERIIDKTVIVRKKALTLLVQILLNHPYKNQKYLIPIKEEIEIPVNEISEEKLTNFSNEYKNDFNYFVKLIEGSLNVCVLLLDCSVKTDLAEIFTFIKNCYIYKVKDSKEALSKIMNSIFVKEQKETTIGIFKELFIEKKEFIFDFINNEAFEEILKNLPIDGRALFNNLQKSINVRESLYILGHINRPISISTGIGLLKFSTDRIFTSEDDEILMENISIYNSTLRTLQGIEEKVEHSSDLFKILISNICKMKFYEENIITFTVKVFYSVSTRPEINSKKFIKWLIKAEDQIKVIDGLGCIALEESKQIEKLEKLFIDKFKEGKLKSVIEEYKENLNNSIDQNLNKSTVEDGDNCFKYKMKNCFKCKMINEDFSNKNEDEIKEYFELLKEGYLLFDPDSILYHYKDLVINSCESENDKVKLIANITLCKWMLVSSMAFHKYYKSIYLKNLLDHKNEISLRNSLVMFLNDFTKLYNSYIDYKLLFGLIKDNDIKKNSILIIYNLLAKNIIRVNGNGALLVLQLDDEDIGSIVRTILRNMSNSHNIISSIFYESFVEFNIINNEKLSYIASLVPTSKKEGLFLKCANFILDVNNMFNSEHTVSEEYLLDRIKRVFTVFNFKEKFIEENRKILLSLSLIKDEVTV